MTYHLQVEQLDEPILHFYGDMAVVQTEISVSCVVSKQIDERPGPSEGGSAVRHTKSIKSKQEKNQSPSVGNPLRLFVTNVFVRPTTSDRYF